MAAVTIHSDFGAQENKVCHGFHCFPIYWPWSDRTRCYHLIFLEWFAMVRICPLGLREGHGGWSLFLTNKKRGQIKALQTTELLEPREARRGKKGFSPRSPLSLRTSIVQNCERNLRGWGVWLNPHCLWSNSSWVGSLHPAFQKLPGCQI